MQVPRTEIPSLEAFVRPKLILLQPERATRSGMNWFHTPADTKNYAIVTSPFCGPSRMRAHSGAPP